MFTGIIEDLGTITEFRPTGESRRIEIQTTKLPLKEVQIGDSVSANGACLTVVAIRKNSFEADISLETLQKTTFKDIKTGVRVNLERALLASSRLNGHMVSGHVDGIGQISSIQKKGNILLIDIEAPSFLCDTMIQKGSVAVDGISLTINECDNSSFSVSIIPHTAKETTLSLKKNGDWINIETDLVGKYIFKFISQQKEMPGVRHAAINKDFLIKTGFI